VPFRFCRAFIRVITLGVAPAVATEELLRDSSCGTCCQTDGYTGNNLLGQTSAFVMFVLVHGNLLVLLAKASFRRLSHLEGRETEQP
jgi:hypothetical protein